MMLGKTICVIETILKPDGRQRHLFMVLQSRTNRANRSASSVELVSETSHGWKYFYNNFILFFKRNNVVVEIWYGCYTPLHLLDLNVMFVIVLQK